MGAGPVRPWEDPYWLREAARIRDQYIAEQAKTGRVIRPVPDGEKLRKRGRALDLARYKGAASDDQKRELLLVAVRQAIEGFDRADLVLLATRLMARVDDDLDELALSKEVRTRSHRLLKNKLTGLLQAEDRPDGSALSDVELVVASLVQLLVPKVGFIMAVTAEVDQRLGSGRIDGRAAGILKEWSKRVVDPATDGRTFVDDCLEFEARRLASRDGLLREDLQESLVELGPALREYVERGRVWANSSNRRLRDKGEALSSIAGELGEDLKRRLIWLDRTGGAAWRSVDQYVGKAVTNAINEELRGRASAHGELAGPSSGGSPTVTELPEATAPDFGLEMEGVLAVLASLESDLLQAGHQLADLLEERRPHVMPTQLRMFRAVFDVTTVTVHLLRSDVRDAAHSAPDELAQLDPDEHLWVRFLAGLARLRDENDSAGWLKPWTFRALRLTDEVWAEKYAGQVYAATRTLPNTHQKRLDRITAGADDYQDLTARGGAVALLRPALRSSIELYVDMRSLYRRGEADGAK